MLVGLPVASIATMTSQMSNLRWQVDLTISFGKPEIFISSSHCKLWTIAPSLLASMDRALELQKLIALRPESLLLYRVAASRDAQKSLASHRMGTMGIDVDIHDSDSLPLG